MSDEFFVMYRSVPRGVRRFAAVVAGVLVVGVGALGGVLARGQTDLGAGVWTDGSVEEMTGVLAAWPYAVLFVDGPAGGAVLVVEPGKRGARPRADEHDGRRVTVRGTALRRAGRVMLELVEGPGAIRAAGAGPGGKVGGAPGIEWARRVTVRGEIVDSKCWHGAMKPGSGRTHRACAALCIRGGIPPVLVAEGGADAGGVLLLTGMDGGPADEAVLARLAEPVEVTGELGTWGGLAVLRVRGSDIAGR